MEKEGGWPDDENVSTIFKLVMQFSMENGARVYIHKALFRNKRFMHDEMT